MATISDTRTRYGRVTKAPVRYEPVEKVTDDYSDGEYDSDEDVDETDDDEVKTDSSDEDEDDESDADEDGNLDGFIVKDEEEDV